MSKIVELLVDWDNLEFDDLGVDIMSLVESPAINIGWQAFSEETLNDYQEEILRLCRTEEFGTIYDPEEIKLINLDQEEFADVSEVLGGLKALDALGNLLPETEGEIMYRYTGRLKANSRFFCKSMIGLNKMYTPTELATIGNLARGVNGSLYPQTSRVNEDGTVSGGIGEWMGGPNCGHYWQKLEVFPNGIVNNLGRAPGAMGRTMDSLANNGYRMSWSFSSDEQQIITGPAMIPSSLIPRKDSMGNIFHVFFSGDTIKKIAQKFLANADNNNTDINHDDQVTTENTLLESWIVEDPEMDKSKKLGYDVPEGTWMVSYKINNKDTWNKIKNGELNGYSVTGQFIEKIIN